jgi:hypothetical protein
MIDVPFAELTFTIYIPVCNEFIEILVSVRPEIFFVKAILPLRS